MAGFFDKLRQGLSKTGSGIAAIFTGSGIDDEFYEELEEALIMADVGMATPISCSAALGMRWPKRRSRSVPRRARSL